MGAADRLQGKIMFYGPIIVMPFALLIFAFSGCNIRKRAEKRACRGGDVKACIELGKYYEDKAPGIIGFLMSYNNDAMVYLDYGCKAKSVEACEKMYEVFAHGADQAKNGSVPLTDTADNLIWGCGADDETLCGDLFEMSYRYGSWVAERAAMAFDKACKENKAAACFWLVRMHQKKLAGLDNIVDEVLPLDEKACAGNIHDSCNSVKIYRARKAELDAKASGSGSGSGAKSAATSAGSGHAP
ncbi:MAG TPA: hypothetical protein VIV58_13560 [Kofleriaceae bacterium]